MAKMVIKIILLTIIYHGKKVVLMHVIPQRYANGCGIRLIKHVRTAVTGKLLEGQSESADLRQGK